MLPGEMPRSKSDDGTTIRNLSARQGVRSIARDFRRQQTPAERTLWQLLRDRKLDGLKFRRQFPIPPFVADFCCFDLKLLVELDGGVHETHQQAAHDENRDIYLRSLGFTLLRFPNSDVFNAPDTVRQRIIAEARHLRS
jgi:very-short-patch-repair endonuclease